MDGVAKSLVASSGRPLAMRMRPDLIVRRQTYQGRHYWVIKDPVALKYHRFEDEEYALLEMLDGTASPDQIKRRFDRRFAPQRISLPELHQFAGMLYHSSLLVSDAAGQGTQLRMRHDETIRRERFAAVSNILSIRLKGFDPDRLLTWLNGKVGWFFSLPVLFACLILVSGALLLVATQFDVFQAKLPGFREFFAAKNWVWLAATLAVTKVLHEFGHGLSCKRFGGECHEMGVMFLVLTPCLYCNVSDSWMLPSKWRRAAIGAAGMYVELVIAALCTFVWWFSQPGMLNYLSLNVMFVSSVSTLLFNANPLLRYDGYYILSDLAEIPNLRQKATTILQRKLGAWCLGLPEPHDPFLPQRRQWLLAVYSVAAAVYRWLVTFSIFWFLYRVLEPYGLKVFGQMLGLLALYGLFVQPLWQLAKFFNIPGRMERVKKARLYASLALVVAALAGVALIPLPHYVVCGLYVQPRGATAVYVDVPGSIQQVHYKPGQTIAANEPLVTLANIDIELAVARLKGQLQRKYTQLRELHQRNFADESIGLEIEQVAQSIAALEEQLEMRRRQQRRLEVHAPVAGTIVPPPAVPEGRQPADRLRDWNGVPLEDRNTGAYLSDGVLLCQIGDPHQLEAVLAIDQADIEFIRPGQPVEMFLAQVPGRQFDSQVARVSPVKLQFSPLSLSSKSGGQLATTTDPSGRERPLSTTYQVSAVLADPKHELFIGACGQAKVHVGYRTIGSRVWRYLIKTFHFEL